MQKEIPISTVRVFARTIFKEASAYGFRQLDFIRLVNELLDSSAVNEHLDSKQEPKHDDDAGSRGKFSSLPITGERVIVRDFNKASDSALLKEWLPDKYGRFFILSCATAQSVSIDTLIEDHRNHFAIITTLDDRPIGALAFLDHSIDQKRAEMRKLIGNPEARGQGFAEEATRLWIGYGFEALGLEKIYVSTLQTNISNIKLNERVGLRMEGLLRNEVLVDGERHDVLRMGIYR